MKNLIESLYFSKEEMQEAKDDEFFAKWETITAFVGLIGVLWVIISRI